MANDFIVIISFFISAASAKDIFMDCCVRAPCVLRRRQNRDRYLSKG